MKHEQKFGPLPILTVCLGLGAVGLALRFFMLDGHEWAYPCLWIVSLVGLVSLVLICRYMGKRKRMEKNFPADPLAGMGTILGAGLLFASSLITMMGQPDVFDAVTAALGMVGAVCLGIQAKLRREGSASALAGMVLTLSLSAHLVSSFRHWSSDPLLGDYCFQLLASVFAMLAAYGLAGFPLGKGRRRLTLFYTHAAILFCLISLADGGVENRLFYGGIALWLLMGGCTRKQPAGPRRKLGGGHVEEDDEEE